MEGSVNQTQASEESVIEQALENFVILQQISKHSSFATIKNFRLVNKIWNEANEKQWNSYTVPRSISEKEESAVLYCSEKSTVSLSKFLREEASLLNNSDVVPIRNVVLCSWDLTTMQNGDKDLKRRFVTLFGPHVQFLTLRQCQLPADITGFLLYLREVFVGMEKLHLDKCFSFLKPSETSTSYLDNLYKWIRKNRNLERFDNLKSLRITSLRLDNEKFSIEWKLPFLLFPSLEEISIEDHMVEAHMFEITLLLYAVCRTRTARNLKKLDLMHYTSSALAKLNTLIGSTFPLDDMNLDQFTLDIGYENDWETPKAILETQAASVKKLSLFRAPIRSRFTKFPCELAMLQLTELCLWGNICKNLNFLRNMPSLKKLKWITTCYDNVSHGKKLHAHLKHNLTPVTKLTFDSELVVETSDLDEDFKLVGMKCLETDWELTAATCWSKLGKWMPNLTELKAVVMHNLYLETMGEQWSKLERLELAHGSQVSAIGIFHVFGTRQLFKNLNSFVWNACACTVNRHTGEVERQRQELVEQLLGEAVGNEIILPWKNRQGEESANNGDGSFCLQALFEKALKNYWNGVPEFFTKLPLAV